MVQQGGVSGKSVTATTRQDTFKLAQGFRAQIADEQIHYDINQFATISSPTLEDERSSLLAGLDNMIYTDDAQAGTSTVDDFHTVANFQTVDERSSGAGWLSYLDPASWPTRSARTPRTSTSAAWSSSAVLTPEHRG